MSEREYVKCEQCEYYVWHVDNLREAHEHGDMTGHGLMYATRNEYVNATGDTGADA